MTSGSPTGLGQRAARGASVAILGQGVRIGVQLASVVILARMLAPSDYGLMAMVALAVGIAEVFRDFGLSSAAIQTRDLSLQQRSNLFWINSAIGLLLSIVMVGSGPLLAHVFGRPELVGLAAAFGWLFVINGLATQHRADLVRRMQFGRLTAIDIAAPVVALAAAVALAAEGAGYWALAAQQLLAGGVMLGLVLVIGGWMPQRPRRNVEMRHFFRFGGGLVASQTVGYAANNVDTFVIGLRFSAADLGFYTRAFQLLMVPLNQIRAPLTQVALPVLARLQDQPDRFAAYVGRGQLLLGYGFLPVLAVVAAAHESVVEVLLGQQWEPVGPILAMIAIAAGFQLLAFVGYWVYLAKGLTTELFQYTLISAAIKLVCVLVGSTAGLLGVAVGYAAAPALSWPLSLWWLSRHSGLRLRPLYAGAGRVLAVSAAVGLAAAVVCHQLDGRAWVELLAATATGGVVLATALVVAPVRRDAHDLRAVVRLVRGGATR